MDTRDIPEHARAVMFTLVAAAACAGCSASRPPLAPSPSRAVIAARQARGEEPALGPDTLRVETAVSVEAPVDVVWSVLDDADAYWSILPRVVSLRSHGRQPDGSLVLSVEHGLSFLRGGYTVRLEKRPPYILEGRLLEDYPHSFRHGFVRVELSPLGAGRTWVDYRAGLDPGDNVLLALASGRMQQAMAQPPWLLKWHVEQGQRGVAAWGTGAGLGLF